MKQAFIANARLTGIISGMWLILKEFVNCGRSRRRASDDRSNRFFKDIQRQLQGDELRQVQHEHDAEEERKKSAPVQMSIFDLLKGEQT